MMQATMIAKAPKVMSTSAMRDSRRSAHVGPPLPATHSHT